MATGGFELDVPDTAANAARVRVCLPARTWSAFCKGAVAARIGEAPGRTRRWTRGIGPAAGRQR